MLLTISTDATASKASDCDCLVGVVFVTDDDDDDDDNDDGVTGEVFLLMLGLIIIVCNVFELYFKCSGYVLNDRISWYGCMDTFSQDLIIDM